MDQQPGKARAPATTEITPSRKRNSAAAALQPDECRQPLEVPAQALRPEHVVGEEHGQVLMTPTTAAVMPVSGAVN